MKTIDKNLTSELECRICLEVPKIETRVFQCYNGHIFCQLCYVKLDFCPTCRKKLSGATDVVNQHGAIRSLLAENLIRQLFNSQDAYQVDAACYTNTTDDSDALKIPPKKEVNSRKEIHLPSANQIKKSVSNSTPKDFGVYWGRRLPNVQ